MVSSTKPGSGNDRQASALLGYVAIPASLVRYWGESRCDLYQVVSWSRKPQLFCAANYPLTAAEIGAIASREVDFLYVAGSEYPRMQEELYARLGQIVESEEIPLKERYAVVKDVVATEMKKVFQLIHLDGALDRIHNMGQKISQLAISSNVVPAEMLAIAMHDSGTFKHLINVSAYAVLLAKHLGISDENELKDIATGGLLHDIGKRFLPKNLLNKSTAFTERERRVVNQHPTKGYVELHRHKSVSRGQKMMVYQHHERVNGQGYPVGITGEEIHPWARICAVVDVHEAMTGKRCYRNADPVPKVLAYLREKADTYFDKEIFRCWELIVQ
jgi:putative nucleotidyltransferase with HDIG domain